MKAAGIDLDDIGLYDLRTDFINDELKQLCIDCINEQKKAAQHKYAGFLPAGNALTELSAEKLQGLLGANQDIHGISTNKSISNVITFGEAKLDDTIIDPEFTGWFDRFLLEPADKCAWNFGTTYTTTNGARANVALGGRDYLLQQLWVPATRGYCTLDAGATPSALELDGAEY